MTILFFIPIIFLHVFEAWHRANFGTKNLGVIQLLFSLLLAVALPSIEWWQGLAAFVAVRAWYDCLLNAFSGLAWYYLPKDAIFKEADGYAVLLIRFLIFAAAVLIFMT
jgi:hypothetical protein